MRIKKENLTQKQIKIISIIALVLVGVFFALAAIFIGRPMMEFFSDPEEFRLWVEDKGILGKIAFILMIAFQVVVAFVPGEPLEIGAGYAFGAIEGTILCVIGITLGSLIVFLLVKKFGIRLVEVFFSREKIKSLRFLRNKKSRNLLVFIVFFLPGTPKDLITYFVPILDIKFSLFFILASVARLPSIITSTLGGGALGTADYLKAILVFAITAVLSGIGWLIYNFISKRKKSGS